MTKRGRPSLYKPEYAAQAAKLAALGATNAAMADFFDVAPATFDNWLAEYPELLGAVKTAKDELDSQVVRSLYHRAMGYSHPAVKIFIDKKGAPVEVPYTEHYPPDTVACIFWLKNRQPATWRDRKALEHSGPDGTPLPDMVKLQLVKAS